MRIVRTCLWHNPWNSERVEYEWTVLAEASLCDRPAIQELRIYVFDEMGREITEDLDEGQHHEIYNKAQRKIHLLVRPLHLSPRAQNG